jgi:SAM-dependent methyltransferase
MSLLDVGCGPGTITVDLARWVAPGIVTAIDPAPDAVAATTLAIGQAGLTTATATIGDIYTLDAGDDRFDVGDRGFDVVHAHQVLQHVPDPVAALRRMRALRSAAGVVAARDADYAAFTWFPQVPALDDWLALYRQLARTSGGEPDAGRRLLSWARAAGFTEVTASASVWCYATPDSRAWWGGMWADRIVDSAIAGQALASGAASAGDLSRIRAGWLEWAASEDGWFVVPHGEILCRG